MPPLELLIQSHETKKFFVDDENWTDNPNLARVFPTATAAFTFARENGLHDVEVVWLPLGGTKVERIIHRRHSNHSRGLEATSRKPRRCKEAVSA